MLYLSLIDRLAACLLQKNFTKSGLFLGSPIQPKFPPS